MQQLTPVVELVLRDESGSQSAVTIHIEVGSTYATADAWASALASVVLSITGCELVRQRIQYRAVNDTPIPAADGSSIKRCGVFIFETEDEERQALIEVPGIPDYLLVTEEPGAGVLIDTTNDDVADFLLLIEGGIATNPFADDITVLATAYRQSRV